MNGDRTIEDRLRRTFAAVASQIPDASEGDVPAQPAGGSGHRRSRLGALSLLVAVTLLLLGTAVLVRAVQSKNHRVVVNNGASSTQPPTTTSTTRPRVVSGTEQRIEAVANVSDSDNLNDHAGHLVAGTTAQRFSVDGATRFAISQVATFSPTPGVGQSPNESPPSVCLTYPGTVAIGGQGIGTQEDCAPLAQADPRGRQPIFLLPAFPKPVQDTTVWTQLPSKTAYVTFNSQGIAHLWERPVQRTVGFSVDTPLRYQGPDFRSAPSPVMRAYDQHGNLLAQFTAARYLGDPLTPNGS